ncbi:hypothetical protein F5051DRAFT_507096 [Lentinula edodes]|nr:hypothetical protein F5051DRAFT_507096 [Lentinula edodes]
MAKHRRALYSLCYSHSMSHTCPNPRPLHNHNFMPIRRRPSQKLRALYKSRQSCSISPTDGQGFLYAFVDNGNCWKIGMSNHYQRRKTEWERQCPCANRIWLPPIRVSWRRRSESLAHLSLELECFDRPHIYCAHCRKNHIEKFIFIGSWYSVWRTVIRPTLVRAAVA